MKKFTYKQAIQRAKALHDVGATEIRLDCTDNLPWHLVYNVDMCTYSNTGFIFKAKHHASKLEFYWALDLEFIIQEDRVNPTVKWICKRLSKVDPKTLDHFYNCLNLAATRFEQKADYLRQIMHTQKTRHKSNNLNPSLNS